MHCSNLVHITARPSFGNGKVNWNITPLQISPAVRGIVSGPVVVQAKVVGRMIVLIAVVPGDHTLDGLGPVASQISQIPWQEGRGLAGHV
jgi:hypothetical protein